MSIAYTSEATCDVIARRAVREYERGTDGTYRRLTECILPLVSDIGRSQKVRQPLRPFVNGLARTLKTLPNLLAVDVVQRGSVISPNETYIVRTVAAQGVQKTNAFVFDATEIRISRKMVEMVTHIFDIEIAAHVLSRYMFRERRDVSSFFSDVLRSIACVMPLALAATEKDCNQIAVPLRNGLLFGNFGYVPKRESAPQRIISRFTAHDQHTISEDAPYGIKGFRMLTTFLTFVDDNSLTPPRERLRDELLAYEERHRDANTQMLVTMTGDHFKTNLPRELWEPSFTDAKAIVEGEAWTKFAQFRMRETA